MQTPAVVAACRAYQSVAALRTPVDQQQMPDGTQRSSMQECFCRRQIGQAPVSCACLWTVALGRTFESTPARHTLLCSILVSHCRQLQQQCRLNRKGWSPRIVTEDCHDFRLCPFAGSKALCYPYLCRICLANQHAVSPPQCSVTSGATRRLSLLGSQTYHAAFLFSGKQCDKTRAVG